MSEIQVTAQETVTSSDNVAVAAVKHVWNGIKAVFGGDAATNKQLIGAAVATGVGGYLLGTNITHNAVLSGKRAVKIGGVVVMHRN